MSEMTVFWLIFAILMFIVEGVTVQFVALWLGLGAIIAMIPAALNTDTTIQLLVWVISSFILLICTRPFIKKVLKTKKISTNADSNIGKVGTVMTDIDGISGNGRVYVGGLDWAARSEDGVYIEKDTKVLVKAIEGVTLIVEKLI